jgi:hypothetical protein
MVEDRQEEGDNDVRKMDSAQAVRSIAKPVGEPYCD